MIKEQMEQFDPMDKVDIEGKVSHSYVSKREKEKPEYKIWEDEIRKDDPNYEKINGKWERKHYY